MKEFNLRPTLTIVSRGCKATISKKESAIEIRIDYDWICDRILEKLDPTHNHMVGTEDIINAFREMIKEQDND